MEQKKFYELFHEKFVEWFNEQDDAPQRGILEEVLGFSVEEHSNWNGPDTCLDELIDVSMMPEIYKFIRDNRNSKALFLDKFDFEGVLKDIMEEVADMDWEFASEFIEDYASEMAQYDHPEGFFEDLQNGGCQSGMVGWLIYYNDIRQVYIKYMDSIDYYIAELEAEMGSHYTVLDVDKQPRFNYAVCMVYEEYAYRIYNALFED